MQIYWKKIESNLKRLETTGQGRTRLGRRDAWGACWGLHTAETGRPSSQLRQRRWKPAAATRGRGAARPRAAVQLRNHRPTSSHLRGLPPSGRCLPVPSLRRLPQLDRRKPDIKKERIKLSNEEASTSVKYDVLIGLPPCRKNRSYYHSVLHISALLEPNCNHIYSW